MAALGSIWRANRSAATASIAIALCCLNLSQPVQAAELLMFEEAGCPWCARWHRDVGPGYPNSSEGQVAPLRRLELGQGVPSGIALAAPVRVTPTFILVERGREVGRITGYPGPDFFWGLLDGLMRKLAPEVPQERR